MPFWLMISAETKCSMDQSEGVFMPTYDQPWLWIQKPCKIGNSWSQPTSQSAQWIQSERNGSYLHWGPDYLSRSLFKCRYANCSYRRNCLWSLTVQEDFISAQFDLEDEDGGMGGTSEPGTVDSAVIQTPLSARHSRSELWEEKWKNVWLGPKLTCHLP